MTRSAAASRASATPLSSPSGTASRPRAGTPPRSRTASPCCVGSPSRPSSPLADGAGPRTRGLAQTHSAPPWSSRGSPRTQIRPGAFSLVSVAEQTLRIMWPEKLLMLGNSWTLCELLRKF